MLVATSGSLWAQDQNNSNDSKNCDKNNNCCKSNKPCVHITVHKQLDKDGNIISYDSVYSYTFGGNMADTAFMNSIMQNGNISIQMHIHPNGMIDFMNDPFLQRFDMNIDMDQMQKMMEKQMQDFMQNAEMNDIQMFIPPQPPRRALPPNSPKKPAPLKKKGLPKHNVSNQGVQI